MVGPEEGSWRVDEVTVSSSRSRHTDRFVCRDALGSSGQGMGFLAPVPQDAVVYGSGESTVILTRVGAATPLKNVKSECTCRTGSGWVDADSLSSALTILRRVRSHPDMGWVLRPLLEG